LDGRTTAKCSVNVLDSGTATADAVANYPGLGIAASAAVAVSQDSTTNTMDGDASTMLADILTVGNYPAGSSFFADASLTATAGGQAEFLQIVLSLNLSDGFDSTCDIDTFGQNSCSTAVTLQDGPIVAFGLNLLGGAGATCDFIGCASGSNLTGSGKILVIQVIDSRGNPVKGATISSASGYQYPTRFASTTALTANPNPSTQGQPVKFRATVASFGRAGYPTGRVIFKDSTTGKMFSVALNNIGVATLTTSILPVGSHSITATYGGDVWSAPSQASIVQVVN